jgi:Domain of unknown function (DUF5668)
MSRTRGLLVPLLLIAIGVIVLLANTGALSQQALERLGDLWPLLLVILGLQLILNHTLPRRQATLIGMGATAVIVIAALLYATLAPAAPFGARQADFSEPVGGLTAATLDLNYGGATADIQAGSIGESLYQAHVDYPGTESPPSISLDRESGTLAIHESSGIQLHLFGSSRRHVLVTLSDRIPWTIQIGGGAVSLRLDVRRLQLSKLQVSGGASRLDAQLPSPKGTVLIDVSGGATDLTLRAPAGSQWHIAASGGISAVTVNGSSFGGIGDFQRSSPGYATATDRFDIEISGGASHVDFRTG